MVSVSDSWSNLAENSDFGLNSSELIYTIQKSSLDMYIFGHLMELLEAHGDFLQLVTHTYQENGFQCVSAQSLQKTNKNLPFTKMANFAWINSLSLENLMYLLNGSTSKRHFPCPSCKLIMLKRLFAHSHLGDHQHNHLKFQFIE